MFDDCTALPDLVLGVHYFAIDEELNLHCSNAHLFCVGASLSKLWISSKLHGNKGWLDTADFVGRDLDIEEGTFGWTEIQPRLGA